MNMITLHQRQLRNAKNSASYWEQQRLAANVLAEVVRNIVQVIAEADEYAKLGVKRAIVEDSMVVYSAPAVQEALTTLRNDHRGAKLADHYSELFGWYLVLGKCRTFKDWDECRANVVRIRCYFHNHHASVVHNSTKFEAHFKQIATAIRADITKANKAMFPKVAVNKAVRKSKAREQVKRLLGIFQDITMTHTQNVWVYDSLIRLHTTKRKQEYGFNITFAIWANAIRIRSLGRNWYVGSI